MMVEYGLLKKLQHLKNMWPLTRLCITSLLAVMETH